MNGRFIDDIISLIIIYIIIYIIININIIYYFVTFDFGFVTLSLVTRIVKAGVYLVEYQAITNVTRVTKCA